jgi:site-specific recombinase XerD
VPIPGQLVEALRELRPEVAKGNSLVFCIASDRPDTHMLRALKRNATRAGLEPERYWLHKFRATFATMHLAAGVDLRTVQSWLGHTNLESNALGNLANKALAAEYQTILPGEKLIADELKSSQAELQERKLT